MTRVIRPWKPHGKQIKKIWNLISNQQNIEEWS